MACFEKLSLQQRYAGVQIKKQNQLQLRTVPWRFSYISAAWNDNNSDSGGGYNIQYFEKYENINIVEQFPAEQDLLDKSLDKIYLFLWKLLSSILWQGSAENIHWLNGESWRSMNGDEFLNFLGRISVTRNAGIRTSDANGFSLTLQGGY